MGRDTLTPEEEYQKIEEIISRREKESNWSRSDWDYTEWEEAYDELYSWKRRRGASV